jgi:GntR family transcriptional regulator, vanillate catabolism transcriptional regulator
VTVRRQTGPSPQVLRAVLRLREMILLGELRPGRRVPELGLVSSAGVSRTPLRLAMERLEHEGLLERRSGGGFVVREFTLAEIHDAIELRGTLEGMAARLAAERFGEGRELDVLRGIVRRLDVVVRRRSPRLPDFERYIALNDRFHRALLDGARSHMLGRLMAQVIALPFASPSAFVMAQAAEPGCHEIMVIGQEHHRTILDAIERREGTRAEALAREHARLALRSLDIASRDYRAWQTVPGGALIRLA